MELGGLIQACQNCELVMEVLEETMYEIQYTTWTLILSISYPVLEEGKRKRDDQCMRKLLQGHKTHRSKTQTRSSTNKKKYIYSLPFRVTSYTKLHEFQYKVLNKCLPTNVFLHKIGIYPSPACSFCGYVDETLEHILVYCNYSESFWRSN